MSQAQNPLGWAAQREKAAEIATRSLRAAKPPPVAWSAKSLSVARTAHMPPQAARPSASAKVVVLVVTTGSSKPAARTHPSRYLPALASPPLAAATSPTMSRHCSMARSTGAWVIVA